MKWLLMLDLLLDSRFPIVLNMGSEKRFFESTISTDYDLISSHFHSRELYPHQALLIGPANFAEHILKVKAI